MSSGPPDAEVRAGGPPPVRSCRAPRAQCSRADRARACRVRGPGGPPACERRGRSRPAAAAAGAPVRVSRPRAAGGGRAVLRAIGRLDQPAPAPGGRPADHRPPTGAARACDVIRMLSRDGRPTPLGDAIAHYGRIAKTPRIPRLVDTEGCFWSRTVGVPRDGEPREGELRRLTREGATFAAAQSRQNSLPSMSCIARHDSL